ncbi:cleavage and polyadenylation specificity factor subunit 7-like isoform X1 [Scomber japonicus]|uniref:cleavage and polyadenylation specificity factor subunit 7-like isoform X1 n=1 Tax=Scomber japonicus TaxID=13676 RepID=UPI0023066760|nr:cleavage and polyadenylation specificity factor subunit 7-like isoform X1 [Scomber japonicus]
MAAAQPAAGPSTSQKDLIDIYSDLNSNQEDLDRIAEANELFDAVLTGSVDQDKTVSRNVVPPPSKETPAKEMDKQEEMKTPKEGNSSKRLSLYIGNFPWWTSDKDLTCMAQTLGVKDIMEIKFAENRVNGQSRGYAELVVTSEESLKTLLEKIPQCELNGERVDCRFATRQNLTVFEDVANKRIPLRANAKDPKESPDSCDKIPSLLSQEPSPPTIPPLFPSHPLANRFPSLPNPFLGQPPPPFPRMPPTIPPLLPPHLFPPHPVSVPTQPSPSLHINPAFFTSAQDGHSSKGYSQQTQTSKSTDGDFEELMNRNRAVASSAITKAVSGATAGDLRVAMETLLTAIAIIKQSRVFGDERCQALVTSLKDCLVSIQGNYGYRSSSRSGDKERDRERDRGRDRERERDRDRDREDSSGWEGAGMSRRHRDRSRESGERNKERSRERDRHRDRYR